MIGECPARTKLMHRTFLRCYKCHSNNLDSLCISRRKGRTKFLREKWKLANKDRKTTKQQIILRDLVFLLMAMFTVCVTFCWFMLHKTLFLMLFQICVLIEMKLLEYKHFKIISYFCYHLNSEFWICFIVPPPPLKAHFFINNVIEPINGDLMNIVAIHVTIRAKYKKLNHNKTRLRNVDN